MKTIFVRQMEELPKTFLFFIKWDMDVVEVVLSVSILFHAVASTSDCWFNVNSVVYCTSPSHRLHSVQILKTAFICNLKKIRLELKTLKTLLNFWDTENI